jgi:pyridoxamine 5'-phosphate oxidase
MEFLSKETIEKAPVMTGAAPEFDTANLPKHPGELFASWFEVALEKQVGDARAMHLATVDKAGLPDVRVVNLMAVDDNGFSFGTGSASMKSEQLEENQVAALSFYWQPLLRAVRIRGEAQLAPTPEGASGGFQIWTVRPSHVEFWQGGGGHNATRIHYDRTGEQWSSQVLG